jgi:hypothetical protein
MDCRNQVTTAQIRKNVSPLTNIASYYVELVCVPTLQNHHLHSCEQLKAKTTTTTTIKITTRYYSSINGKNFYRDADKSLARPASRCILFDDENISLDASLVIYINTNNIPPIIIINRIYETQNLLSL